MPDALSGEFVLENTKDTHKHEHSKPHFYSSLGYYPDGVVFQNQEADEEVVLLIRRDFITNVPWIATAIVLAVLPIIVGLLLPFFAPSFVVSPILQTLIITSYYTFLAGFLLVNFAIWYFNAGIVTNKRIIDLDVPNILIKHTSEARLNSVADVSFTQVGGIRSFFDYGDVEVQTEAVKLNIEFDRTPNPNMVRRVIGELTVDRPST